MIMQLKLVDIATEPGYLTIGRARQENNSKKGQQNVILVQSTCITDRFKQIRIYSSVGDEQYVMFVFKKRQC